MPKVLCQAYELPVGLQASEVRMILITGADVHANDTAAVSLFEAGHVPLMAEWFAFPVLAVTRDGDGDVAGVSPVIERLLTRCDAVLRMTGASSEADAIVGLARARGLRVYFSVREALNG